MIDLSAIKAAAEAATPGPWATDDPWIVYAKIDKKVVYLAKTSQLDTMPSQFLKDAAFIAAANPAAVLELIALTERLQSELTAAHEQLGYNAKPNDSQEWARISGAVAHQLIERHADDWREAGDMMEAFAASRAAARPAVVLSDEPPQDQLSLPGWLRHFAADSGYSHNDYADTMRQAADEIERLSAQQAPAGAIPEHWRDCAKRIVSGNLKEQERGNLAVMLLCVLLKAPADAGQAQALAVK